MNFQIMQHAGGRKFVPVLDDATNEPMILDCAKRAKELAAKLTAERGIKFQPRPVASKVDWHERELKRFKTGEYTPVLWTKEKWWKEIDGHFAHIGVKDAARIAYTPDATKSEADRQTVTLPGKYLTQFFGDVLTPEQIRTFAMQHSTQFEKNELKFARTVEEIERVYKPSLGSSCFSGSTKANLYASGDFEVAYIEDDNGKITARAVCSVKDKFYPRTYGDDSRLKTLLEAAGYKVSTDGNKYRGLRLLKQWYWEGFYADFYPSRCPSADPENPEFLILNK